MYLVYDDNINIFQAIYKNALEHKVAIQKEQKKKNPVRHKLIKKLIGLALLPNNKIIEGFEIINQERLIKFPSDINLHSLFDYYKRQWLSNTESFCAYKEEKRTNNVIENNNRWMSEELGTRAQPEVFLGKILLYIVGWEQERPISALRVRTFHLSSARKNVPSQLGAQERTISAQYPRTECPRWDVLARQAEMGRSYASMSDGTFLRAEPR